MSEAIRISQQCELLLARIWASHDFGQLRECQGELAEAERLYRAAEEWARERSVLHMRAAGPLLAEFDHFAAQCTGRIALLELPTDPREPIPSPNGAIVRFAKTVDTAGQLETMRNGFRRVVRFA